MDFNLTKEQEMIQKMMRKFSETEVAPIAEELDVEAKFPFSSVEKLGKLGVMGMPFPAEYGGAGADYIASVSYTHLRAHETRHDLVCRLLLEKKKKNQKQNKIT